MSTLRTLRRASRFCVATVAGLAAQGAGHARAAAASGRAFAEPWRPAAAVASTKIVGTVIDIRQVPVAYAQVAAAQSRDRHGRSRAASPTRTASISSPIDEPGTYVVEMVLVDGYVLALSNAGSLARYETLRTVVQLPGRWEASARGMVMPQNVDQLPRHERGDDDDGRRPSRSRSNRASSRSTRASRFLRSSRSSQPMSNRHARTARAPTPTPPPAAPAARRRAAPVRSAVGALQVPLGERSRVFLLVVGWVMVDSYTRIPMYRATARVLIEDPNADVATPTEIARSVTLGDPEIYMQTQLRIMKGRDLAQRVAGKLDLSKVAEFNGQGPKPTQLARRHRAGQVLRGLAVSPDHVDAGRRAGDGDAARRRSTPTAIADVLIVPLQRRRRCAAASWST